MISSQCSAMHGRISFGNSLFIPFSVFINEVCIPGCRLPKLDPGEVERLASNCGYRTEKGRTKDTQEKTNFSIWSQSVEQVYSGIIIKYQNTVYALRSSVAERGRGKKGTFCLHLSPTSVHNLRDFSMKIILNSSFLCRSNFTTSSWSS